MICYDLSKGLPNSSILELKQMADNWSNIIATLQSSYLELYPYRDAVTSALFEIKLQLVDLLTVIRQHDRVQCSQIQGNHVMTSRRIVTIYNSATTTK